MLTTIPIMKNHLFCSSLLCFFLLLSFAVEAQEVKFVKVLAVGNSFSENATDYLQQIVAGSPVPCKLTLGKASIGGCDFDRHNRHAAVHEKDPDDPEGKPYLGKKSLKEMLLAEKWDYITIQQVSVKSYLPETFEPEAKKLYDYIKKYAPQAEVVIHQTWAYRSDDSGYKDGFGGSQKAMYEGLCKAYGGLADELHCRIIRCGDTMELARRSPDWGDAGAVKWDSSKAKYPELPDQRLSLHSGYSWVKNKEKDKWEIHYDGHHASDTGKYLLSCVWFEFFFDVSCVDNTFVPEKLSKDDAAILRRIAHEVNDYEYGLKNK